MNILFVIIGNI